MVSLQLTCCHLPIPVAGIVLNPEAFAGISLKGMTI